MPLTKDEIIRFIDLEAAEQDVDPRFAQVVAQQESWFNPNAVGDKGQARGIFQLHEAAAKDAGIDPARRHEVPLNIEGGVRYLKQQLDRFGGDQRMALAAYNAGPTVVQAYGKVPPYKGVQRYVADAMALLSPRSAEAAGLSAAERARLAELEASLAQDEGQAQATSPAPPTATSTPAQDAAYRSSRGTQTPAPVSQATPQATTPSQASQGPSEPLPDPTATPGMRFQALPSITQLEPGDRMQKTKLFESLNPKLQEEFLRSEEPVAGGLAMGGGPVAQSQPVTDPAALLAGGTRQTPPPLPASAPGPAQPQALPGPVRPAGLTRLTPDMDDDAIIRTLGYDPEVVKKSSRYTPGEFKAAVTDPNSTYAAWMNTPIGGVSRGMYDVIEEGGRMALRGLGKVGIIPPEDIAYKEAMIKLGEADYQQNIRHGAKVDPETGEAGWFSDPSRLVGQAVSVPIPGGAATTIPRTIARGAVTGAVSGALQPVTGASTQPGSETDDYWTQKGTQTAVGGVIGGVLGPVVEKGVVPAVNRGVNWARGIVNPAYQELVELGERFNVRLTGPEITMSPMGQKIETGLEAVPGTGYGTVRRTEQRQVRAAAEGQRTGLQAEMQTTPWRDLAALEAAARGTGQRAKEARALLAEINDAGSDWSRVVQSSGKLNLFQDRLHAEKLYDTVTELAEPLGNMRLPQTTKAIDEAIALAKDDILPSPEVKLEVLGALSRVRGAISPTESVRPSMGVRDPVTGTLRAQPMTPTTSVPATTYGRMRKLRSSLGDIQREAAEPAVARYLGGVKSALEDDMHAFATQSNVPQLSKAAKAADTWYNTRVVKYREGALAQAIEKDLPDEIYNEFVRRGTHRAQYFYNGLDPKGQAAVRAGMVEEAFNKAMSGPNPDIFSPQRYVSAMRKIQEASGVFFKGQPQWEMDGFTKLMQHAPRAGQYMENPPTGWRTGVLGLMLNPWLYLQAVGAGQGVKTLFTSKAGRSLMLAANDLQPGSPALQRAWNKFARQVPRATAIAGSGQADQPSH